MIKKLIIAISSILSISAFAQDGTSSPYSFYGFGEKKQDNTLEHRSMGGVNVFRDSIRLNFNNPASYSHLKFTTFVVSGTQNINELNANNVKSEALRTSLDYLAVAIPLGKAGIAFGLKSGYTTGYRLQNTGITSGNDIFKRDKYYVGTGSINKFFVGGGYEITKNLSLGIDFNYFFGTKDDDFYEIINQLNYLPGTLEINESDISGRSFNFGLMYQRKIYKEIELFAGATYSPQGTMKFENRRNINAIVYGGVIDSYQIFDFLKEEATDSKMKIPSKLSLSLGIGDSKKWGFGVEYARTETSVLKELHSTTSSVNFENANRISIGGFFVPKYNSFRSYLSRVTYRAGYRYENTGIILNNTSVNDSGITFGLGLPIAGIFSSANLGFEYGQRGTTLKGLTLENYFNLSLSLSLSDRWFIKRKYN
jgi:long-subunit fatty acid transport protein